MIKRIAIVQSNYIPWKGYFDLINSVDEFILLDDAQYTRNDWRNRNMIKTAQGPIWLTIPVRLSGNFGQAIKDVDISDAKWNTRHWRSIVQSYAKARYINDYKGVLEELYLSVQDSPLSRVNYRFIDAICRILDIRTTLSWSMDYQWRREREFGDYRTQHLVDLCRQAGATEYLSGPSAKAYIDESLFEQAGIALTWMDYDGYPEYPQLYPPFDHNVSIIDLILNAGPDAPKFMKSFAGRLGVAGSPSE